MTTISQPREPRSQPASLRSPGEALAWLSSLVLLLSAFMGWYTVDVDGETFAVLGWNTGAFGKLVFFVALVVLGLLALRAGGVDVPPGVSTGMVLAVLGALATILVLWRVLAIGDFAPAGRGIGLWIALAAAVGLIVAGLVKAAAEAQPAGR